MASSLLRGADPLAANDGVFPTDVLREILLRVQAKVLCRLRLVCPSWRSLTSDPCFARAHSARHPLFVGLHKGQEYEIHVVDLYSGSIVKRICGLGKFWSHLSMQDGMVCISTIDTSCSNAYTQDLVLNLATGAVNVLPIGDRSSLVLACVLGLVPSTGEYKVVRVSIYRCTVEERIKTTIEVIALGSGGKQKWRAKPSPVDIFAGFHITAVVRGVAYFWASRYPNDGGGCGMTPDLALLDLATEEWRPTIIPGPLHEADHIIKFDSLDECLVITHHKRQDCSMDLWFLMDADNGPYWTKRYSMRCAPHCEHSPPRLLVILEDGRVVVWIELQDVLVVYDPRTQTWNDFAKLEYYFAIGMHQGSLLTSSGLQGHSLTPSSD